MSDRLLLAGLGLLLVLATGAAVFYLQDRGAEDQIQTVTVGAAPSIDPRSESQEDLEDVLIPDAPRRMSRPARGPRDDGGELQRPAGASLQFRLLDNDGIGLPNVSFRLEAWKTSSRFEDPSHGESAPLSAVTDAKGRAEVFGLERDMKFSVELDSSRWYLGSLVRFRTKNNDDPVEVVATALPFALVRGVVKNEAGDPEPSFIVALLSGGSTVSQADGSFELTQVKGLGRGRWAVACDRNLMKTGHASVPALKAGSETSEITIVVKGSKSVTGVVRDDRELPVAGADVTVSYHSGFNQKQWRPVWELLNERPDWTLEKSSIIVKTDAGGNYALPVAFPRRAYVRVRVENGFVRDGRRRLKFAEGEETTVEDFIVDRGGVVQGTIIWPGPLPASGEVSVLAMRTDGRFVRNIKIPVSESFSIPGLTSGSYRLRFHSPGDAPLYGVLEGVSAVLKEVTGPYAVTLIPAAEVRGRVLTRKGKPIANASVYLRQSKSAFGRSRATVSTDDNGYYRAVGWTSGNYRMSVAAKGYLSSSWRDIVLASMRPGKEDFELDAALDLNGRVYFADGSPAVGVDATIRGPRTHRRVKTDVEGRFEANSLPPGKYHVYASATDEIDKKLRVTGSASVHLVAAAEDVFLELLPSLTLRGDVKDRRNRGRSRVRVEVFDPATGLTLFSKKTDRRGRFAFPSLSAGNYRVRAVMKRRRKTSSLINLAPGQDDRRVLIKL